MKHPLPNTPQEHYDFLLYEELYDDETEEEFKERKQLLNEFDGALDKLEAAQFEARFMFRDSLLDKMMKRI